MLAVSRWRWDDLGPVEARVLARLPSYAVAAALERYRTAPDLDEEAHAPSLLVGETGVLMVADRLGSPAADRDRLSELVRANREHSTWELLWGSPGTILAARACGLGDEWRESAQLLYGHWDESSDMWRHDLYGRRRSFIGPAHGFAGNVHALRGFVDEEILRERVARLLTRTADMRMGWRTGRRRMFRRPRLRPRSGCSGVMVPPGSSPRSAT